MVETLFDRIFFKQKFLVLTLSLQLAHNCIKIQILLEMIDSVRLIVLIFLTENMVSGYVDSKSSHLKESIEGERLLQISSTTCSCATIPGCQECENNLCLQCLHSRAFVNQEGQCECYWEDETLDTKGYCVQCRINGCKTCKHDGQFRPLTCHECMDPNAYLINGKCICQEHQLMLDGICSECPVELVGGKCKSCPILGCAICEDGKTCDKCTHPSHWTKINSGQCSCVRSHEAFNTEGVCSICNSPRCSVCDSDGYYSYSCHTCLDQRAVAENGVCSCEDGVEFNDYGYCLYCNEECDSDRCSCCQQNNPSKCLQCVDDPWAVVNEEGQCECYLSWEAFDNHGICRSCYVEGCASCVESRTYECRWCIDPVADNVDGQCVCPEGTQLNEEGLCWACHVLGCERCSEKSQHVCSRCSQGFVQDGKCVCSVSYQKLNENGICSTCEVEGCVSCSSASSTQCRICMEGTFLYEQQCVCIEGSHAMNERGYCSECNVHGCSSCWADSPNICRTCHESLTLESGTCRCPVEGQKLNSKGVCENCVVQGCESCQSGQPNICAQCSDCLAFLIDGQCVCPPNKSWFPAVGACSYEEQAVQSSFESVAKLNLKGSEGCSGGCDACEAGLCSKCKAGFFLDPREKQCHKCDPRCSTCEGKRCLSFYPGWGEYKGEIAHCAVAHCSSCSQNIGKCDQCKDNYLLKNSSFCQLDQSKKSKLNSKSQMSFEEFSGKFGKEYESEKERERRKEIFLRRLEEMEDLETHVDYKLRVNQFFDRTDEELAQVTQSFKPSPASSKLKSSKRKVAASKLGSHPESLNWSERGAVTSIKNQGSCGSCWAFAAAAGAESTLILSGKENVTVDLSEQYLVECTYESDCSGTYHMRYVMEEILEGIPREATYPYYPWQTNPGICQTERKVEVAEDYSQYFDLDDEEIIELLQKGPLVITISADGWNYYSSGVFSCSYDASRNHAVLLVGYAPDYWLIKNSWDDYWGEDGYIRITRDRSQNCWIGNEVLEFNKCPIPGCLQCSSSNSSKCVKCHSSAELVRGACECPKGFTFSGYECVPCQVIGCVKCEISNPYYCEVCSQETQLRESGQCECEDPSHKPTNEGTCVLCQVEGCQFCEAGTQNTCIKCLDCLAFIQDGQCLCEENFKLNESGYCFLDTESLPVICPVPFIEDNRTCICPENYVKVGETCLECIIPNISDCTLCGLNMRNQPICSQCTENKALIDGLCSSDCPEGTYFDSGACQICAQNCLICSDSVTCTKCTDEVILVDGLCQVCENGYFMEDNQCKPCSEGCISCLSSSDCFQCEVPKIVEEDECVDCPPDTFYFQSACHVCSIQGCVECLTPQACKVCASGMVLNDSGECVHCPAGFIEEEGDCIDCEVFGCLSCSSVGVCDQCLDSTAVLDEAGENCTCEEPLVQTEMGYCFEVPEEPSDTTTPGMVPGQQLQCSHGCQQCSAVTQCSKCLSNFFKEGGECIACSPLCLTCKGSTTQDCLSCPSGFLLSSGSCLQCEASNCSSCSSPEVCTACFQTFTLQQGQCESCPDNCKRCSSPSVCSKCRPGFNVQQDGSCAECLSSCSECSSTDIRLCEACSPGQYLSEAQCLTCAENCLECDSPSNCLACRKGFQLQNGECAQECERPCVQCIFVEGQQYCSKCLGGYYSNYYQCESNYYCNYYHTCESCPFGSALVEGVCETCHTNDCRTCSPEDLCQCLSCNRGFFLDKGSCEKCQLGCDECQSANFCVSCSEGYFQLLVEGSRTGKCSSCESPCLACENSASSCLSCVDGFSKEGWKCISDIQVKFDLLIDAEIQAFLEKIAEFRAFLASLLSLTISEDSITLTLLESGSVRVQGSLQAQSSKEGQTIFEDMSSSLQEGKSMMGYQILESQIEKQNIEHIQVIQVDPQEPEPLSVGAIIGMATGGVVLIIVCICLNVLCRKKSNSQVNEREINQVGQWQLKHEVTRVGFTEGPSY